MTSHLFLAQAQDNFLIQKNYEEIIESAIIKNKANSYNFLLNTNLSDDFMDIYDDVSSKDSNRVNDRVDSLIGVPLRSTALAGFSIPKPFSIGYFHSYNAFALAQNPVFPEVDVYLSSSHNFWLNYKLKIIQDLSLDLMPVLGFKKSIRETKGVAELINDGLNLNLKNQDSKAFNSLNFNIKYSLDYFDLDLENYNYFFEDNDLYSTFIKVSSFSFLDNHALKFSARYRIAHAYFIPEEKKVELLTSWSWSGNINFELSLNELKFINPRLTIDKWGVNLSVGYLQASQDILREQVSKNYDFRLSYYF